MWDYDRFDDLAGIKSQIEAKLLEKYKERGKDVLEVPVCAHGPSETIGRAFSVSG